MSTGSPTKTQEAIARIIASLRGLFKLGIEVKAYTRKSRRYNSYHGKAVTVAKNRIHRRFYTMV